MPTQTDTDTIEVTVWWHPEVIVYRDSKSTTVDTGLKPLFARLRIARDVLADPDRLAKAVKDESTGLMTDLAAFVDSDEYSDIEDTEVVQGYRPQFQAAMARAIDA